MTRLSGLPPKQGLYNPGFEHDACGIGFVVNIKGHQSHRIVNQALTILNNLTHRGGVGAESSTGDGAGILMQIPHGYLLSQCHQLGFSLPDPGEYGVGMAFLPQDALQRSECQRQVEQVVSQEGLLVLGWRNVPVDAGSLGETAKACMPWVAQLFIGRGAHTTTQQHFERQLYVIRKKVEQTCRFKNGSVYFASLSSRTIVYKGMLTAEQVPVFYTELSQPEVTTALALVHSRFSTNTFPSWERAHPYRYIIHNGEINTLRGNVNWMYARQAELESEVFGSELSKVFPIINPDGSDSANFDNCLEFLALSGRSLPHAAMMMIPEPWEHNPTMDDTRRAFYEYHSCLMEPWDGPAAIAFTDGVKVGAILDRNGLRPARYYVTTDDLVVLASEVGVLDIPPEQVVRKDRLQPGRMLLIDTEAGRIISDAEIKEQITSQYPYQQWLDDYQLHLQDLPEPSELPADDRPLTQIQKIFGYTYEDLRMVLAPMARDGVDPVGAMGCDTPLAVLSDRPQLLANYFKQLFAQVTNPPIDALREEVVTGTTTLLGTKGQLLKTLPENCRQIRLPIPVLTHQEYAKISQLNRAGFSAKIFDITFESSGGENLLEQALERLFSEVDAAVSAGTNIIILSDRGVAADRVPVPALLAVAGLHHHLIRRKTRTGVSLILDSGEPREVHHFALLLGYGVSAVHPYLAYRSVRELVRTGFIDGPEDKAINSYVKAVIKGVVKVISKMGISTIQSYQGAQIFEAIGLDQSVVDRYFTRTPSRIGGITLETIAKETILRHQRAFSSPDQSAGLDSGGDLQWRRNGEEHLYNPETIHKLQQACRKNDYQLYKEYSALINDEQKPKTLRGLLEIKPDRAPIPLDEVEPIEAICHRFKTGAMSYGSISKEAHEALAIAMNRIGGKSNTGEGGEDPARFQPEPTGDSKCSAIKQVASGRFGVTSEYLVNAKEIQIKMAQGAKPGEGGQLPGRKVYPWIAEVRHSTPGVGLISPPPHHDIYSIEDLAELIHDLKNANPEARITVKLVSEVGVGTIAAGVAKGRADVILISGYDGGTGAASRTSIRHAGLPWELGLAETHQTLILNGLRSRVSLETDGKLLTGRDVVMAALLGAEEFGFATTPLVALGCVMMRVCNLDTCPVGIATQNPELRKKFTGDPQHVVNFMHFVAQEVRQYLAELGCHSLNELIGRTELLTQSEDSRRWKAAGLDLSPLLYQPAVAESVGIRCLSRQDHGLEHSLDNRELLKICRPALEERKPVRAILPIYNTDRVVGTSLGSEVTKRYSAQGLPEDTIQLHFKGSAGQSFGAFVPPGISLILEGDGNDYVGKGLSGGKIIVYPPSGSPFTPEENVIIGNVAFYGATSGEAYISGAAGERFCVRNSGADAVVESVGDHACEYMTGGRVVVLGSTGKNFAAGMSGGIAYIFDESGDFTAKCNLDMAQLEPLESEAEETAVRTMIQKHATYTGSPRAKLILAEWSGYRTKLLRVMPTDFKRMLNAFRLAESEGQSGKEAVMSAFQANIQDLSRVSGN